MAANHTMRVLFSVVLILAGAVLSLLSPDLSPGEAAAAPAAGLLSDLGLALVIAGVVSSFHELVIRRLEGDEASMRTADAVHQRLLVDPPSAVGIRLVSSVRKGYPGYYQWALDNGPQTLFFAGRSVLHRIDSDFRERSLDSCESVIERRLREGATFRIMFLDPRCELVPRLAQEEAQRQENMLTDIAVSLGICRRLHALLDGHNLPPQCGFEIRIFDQIPYFAFHRVDEHVIIGFYFSSIKGYASAAYEAIDLQTKKFFTEHFESIFSKCDGQFIVRKNPHNHKSEINDQLLLDLEACIAVMLGQAWSSDCEGTDVGLGCQSASKIDPPSASKTDPPGSAVCLL